MSKYKMVVTWSQADGAFLVEVPELPGCMADGVTREEAIGNAEQVIQEWLSMAREIPSPMDLTEIA